jgi:uncharacterized SAM-binding protein YcdF (DUF218 family)
MVMTMFFVASKVFWMVAQPISVVFLLLVVGVIAGWLGRRRLSLVTVNVATVLLFFVGFTNLGGLIVQPLENRFVVPVPPPEEVSAIIVLGGAVDNDIGDARDVAELNGAGDRMTTALMLARLYPDAPLVFTGGSGSLVEEGEMEAATAERFFVEQGIDPGRLVLESRSRNTAENAEFTAGLVPEGEAPALLVTSAYHMPRSVGLFRKAGVDVVAWPTDYRSFGNAGFKVDIDPDFNIETTTLAIREWIGLLAYQLTGRTDELLPSPQ